MGSKFRSIKAFKEFEQKSRNVDPVRVIRLLKESGQGLRKGELAERLDAALDDVDEALSSLVDERLVRIERADRSEDDLFAL